MNFKDYFLLSGCFNVIISAFYWNKVLNKFEFLKVVPTYIAVLIHFVTGFFILPFLVFLYISNLFVIIRYYYLRIKLKITIWKLRKSSNNLKNINDNFFKRK